MDVRCPYCKDAIAARADGVRCARCATPHHAECWTEHRGSCSVHGCGGTERRPFTRRSAARIVVGAGRHAVREVLAEARGRLGGKTTVALLLLSVGAAGLGTGLAARALVPAPGAGLPVALGSVFAALFAWIATLLYRGDRLHDDLDVQVAAADVGSYYRRLWGGLTGERGGGAEGGCLEAGCHGCAGGGEALAVLAVVGVLLVVVLALAPLAAWLAVELVFPIVALAIYNLLYAALALAVHAGDAYRGRLLACVARGALFAGVYTGVVALLIEAGRWAAGR
ncbi:MAG: hypothetical protein M9894_36590 [Planctomycetes bacterium]|nr:hypothetical protein [Planctomycetota bacterium]